MEMLGVEPGAVDGLPVGHYEAPFACSVGETSMHVWLPLKEPGGSELLGGYRVKVNMAKKVPLMAAQIGLPLPRLCFPTIETMLPTASPQLYAARPDMVSEAVRGLVLFAHGLGDGPLVMAHLTERLASLGFIVAAPSFSDSACNDEYTLPARARELVVEQTALRMHRMDACLAALRTTFPALTGKPLVLIGYSIGTDTVRHMSGRCPRIYIGGPGWREQIATNAGRQTLPVPSPPAGPSLQLLAWPDYNMHVIGLDRGASSTFSGHACPGTRAPVTLKQLGDACTSGASTQLRVDLEPFGHGDFKYPPFHALELQAWRAALCGVNPFNPCGKEVDAATLHERSEIGAAAVVRFLLAVL